MNYKYLIILLFLGITSQSWSQQSYKEILEDKMVRSSTKTISVNQADNILFCNKDTILKCDAINKNIIINCDTIRNYIIGKACEYIGVLYHYGQSSEKGFDCSGYVKFVYKIFGLTLPHSSYAQYKMCNHLDSTEVKPGDLVFFITRGNNISHVGIYLGDNQFIHSPGRGRSVSIDSLDLHYYKRHFVGFGSVL